MKRDTASTIFRTVVFAGAMLGTAACGKKPAANTPANTPAAAAPAAPDPMMKSGDKPMKPAAADESDPCAGGERTRGTADEGGETGRGFILS